MKLALALLGVLSLCVTLTVNAQSRNQTSAGAGLQPKLDHLQHNSQLTPPNPAPTVLTEQEINAYIASGHVQLPAGVQSLRLQGERGVITGNARVDFDRLKSGRNSANPFLNMFSGVHDVVVLAQARGENYEGIVHVDSVSLDGVEIPQFALQLFVDKYIKPRYPDLGIDSRFSLPDKIETAVVGQHEVTLTQR
jgi:hypothetical protein